MRVKSVSRLEPGNAIVRFDTQQQSPGGGAAPIQPWIAVVRYTYSRAPMTLEDRLVNPLGFKVLTYRRSAEAPPPVQVQQVAPGQPVVVRPQVFNEGSSTTVVGRNRRSNASIAAVRSSMRRRAPVSKVTMLSFLIALALVQNAPQAERPQPAPDPQR